MIKEGYSSNSLILCICLKGAPCSSVAAFFANILEFKDNEKITKQSLRKRLIFKWRLKQYFRVLSKLKFTRYRVPEIIPDGCEFSGSRWICKSVVEHVRTYENDDAQIDENPVFSELPLLFRRPVNLVDSYENRFAFACAFGATTGKCIIILLGGGYSEVFPHGFTTWLERPDVPAFLGSK